MFHLSVEDRAAASAVAALSGDNGKREREDWPDFAAGGCKRARSATLEAPVLAAEVQEPSSHPVADEQQPPQAQAQLKPYPFFSYTDHSKDVDPDPLLPLTPPGRVPNFPAKMHSILSRPDLQDVIAWMPHGRSWRVLKPREFEIRVLPTYFEHAKFSSFIRQANGWGFRRVTQGRDRNTYYHELFLRGLPHLCKSMKRPGVAQKPASDPDHEPDFYRITELHPVPEKTTDDSILLDCTIKGGPKARMPIYSGSLTKSTFAMDTSMATVQLAPTTSKLTPRDHEALSAFEKSLGAAELETKNVSTSTPTVTSQEIHQFVLPPSTFAPISALPPSGLPFNPAGSGQVNVSPLAAANQLAFGSPNFAAAFQASTAASQFAAGFAAATALSQQQFKQLLDSFAESLVQAQQGKTIPMDHEE